MIAQVADRRADFGDPPQGGSMPMSDKEPRWQRSTHCGSGTCVEVAQVGDRYLVRDSKNPDIGPLSFTKEEWTAFVSGVKQDEFPC
jgi:hypothetical protein